MALVKHPQPLPTPLDYVPPNSEPANPGPKDSWWTLADRPGPRAAKLSALDLCHFNFGTRKPTEINWYLKNKVGCVKETADGNNYLFASCKFPEKVYLPKVGVVPSPPDYPKPGPGEAMDVWVGVAGKFGSNVVVVGIDIIEAAVFTAGPNQTIEWAMLHGESNRVGPGVGAGGGASVVLATGIKRPSDFQGLQIGPSNLSKEFSLANLWKDLDFNISVGGKLSGWLKGGKHAAKFKPVIDFITKLGAKTPAGLVKIIKNLGADDYANLTKLIITMKSAAGIENDAPSIMVIDLPGAGGGTEVSFFVSVTTYTLLDHGSFTIPGAGH